MIKDLKLIDGDLPARPVLISGVELIKQRVGIRLRTHLGEWVLDRRVGLPYLRWRGQKPPNLAVITSRVGDWLRATRGVEEVRRLRAELVERRVVITGVLIVDGGVALELEAAVMGEGNVSPTVALKLATSGAIL